jgi:phage FluMu gp28-like protein
VYLDEFAYHQNDREIYEAILPAATLGYRISVVSTPLGESGLFYSLWSGEGGRYADFSRHRVTIDDAIGDGLRIDRAAIERNLDADAFRQEYLCEFIDEASAYLPYELLRRAIGDYALCGEHYLGVDIGRKRDITAICVLGKLGETLYVKHIEELSNATFGAQRLAIKSQYAEHGGSRVCVDATGLGMQLAEELQQEILAEPVVFTNESKERMIVRVKRMMEAGRLIIPDNPKLVADLHAIRKEVTASNNVRFDAARTGEGHADRAWALALAVEAATKPNAVVEIY